MRQSIDRRKYETAKTTRTVLRHLKRFSGNPNLCFSDLTSMFLIDFCRYLEDCGCCNNTRLLYLHCLQTLHHRAATQGVTPDPSDLYSIVLTRPDETVKRSISAATLKQIRDAMLPQKYTYLAFARDMFMLSFYLRGIPFVDLAHLRPTDIKAGILRYHRSKTDKPLVVTLEPCAMKIINRWRSSSTHSLYLLPIIKQPGSSKDEQRQYNSGLRLYNKHLNVLPKVVGLPQNIHLTSYTPRHTWADLAHKDGVAIPYISEALSHSSEKTTRHYIASFTTDALAKVNRRVIEIMNRPNYKRKGGEKKERGKYRSGSLIEPERHSNAK